MILHIKFLKRFHKNPKITIVATTFINMNRWKWMLLPCLLVNVQAAIYRNLLLTKCSAFWVCASYHHLHNQFKISFALQRACSFPENPLNHNNHTIVKSFRRIMNFYSYQVNQCLLANTLNRKESKKSFKIYSFCTLICLNT